MNLCSLQNSDDSNFQPFNKTSNTKISSLLSTKFYFIFLIQKIFCLSYLDKPAGFGAFGAPPGMLSLPGDPGTAGAEGSAVGTPGAPGIAGASTGNAGSGFAIQATNKTAKITTKMAFILK